MLSEISQTKTNAVWSLLHIESKKNGTQRNKVEWCLLGAREWENRRDALKGTYLQLVDK